MKVLLVSLFHPEIVRGGAQQICYELFQGLQARDDIEVTLLAAVDESQKALYKSGARITGFDGREGEFLFLSREYDSWWHKTSNHQLLETYAEFLRLIQPDVVHFHHFLMLGIDLLTLTRRVLPDVRIVFTLHEFMTICAADGQMLRTTDGSLCDRASPVRCNQCFPPVSPEQFFIREMWMKKHLGNVDVFTTPSRFMIKHFTDWGIDPAKIVQVTNGQRNYNPDPAMKPEAAPRNRFGFFGQLVDNKGVWVILQAVEQLRASGFTDFLVEINGNNLRYATEKRRNEIEAFLQREGERPIAEQNVIFNGSYHIDQLAARMSRVDWCIVPSTWWEVFGLVISEAWMFRKPVIASNVGGPRERIRHEVDGLLFQVADARALARTMRRACTEDGLWDRLVAGLPEAPAREVMVRAFIEIYANGQRKRSVREMRSPKSSCPI
jgi:glycosyltransferase involved in cell wall biosynthesis